MTTINQLSATDSVSAGDLLALFKQSQGDARKMAVSVLQTYMQNNLNFGIGFAKPTTQRATPSSSGFNVQITDSDVDIHLILTPTTGFAAGTITLPAVGNAIDKQTVLVNCTQQVTSLTVDGNGAVAVTGEPSSLAADDFFTLKYDSTTQTWYRVG